MTQDNSRQNKIITIPNLLSLVRFIMIPFIAIAYKRGRFILSAVLLVLSGVTDVVDGFIARTFNMTSNLGKVLDPIADKLTQLAIMLCLFDRFPLMLLPFNLLLIKEIVACIMGLLVIKKTNKVHSAVWHGKISTALLYAMMFLHIIWGDIPEIVSKITIIICTVMILLSFILYGKLNKRYLNDNK